MLTKRCSQSAMSLASTTKATLNQSAATNVQSESSRTCSHFAFACTEPALAAPCAALTEIQLCISTISAGPDCALPQYFPHLIWYWDARAYSGNFTYVGGQADEEEGRKDGS